jgi:hypothetical protein
LNVRYDGLTADINM